MSPSFATLVWAWVALGAVTSLVALRIPAPYGRHARPGWGPLISDRAGWMVMESVVLVAFWSIVGRTRRPLGGPAIVMAGLFTLHYAHRAWIYPWRVRSRGRTMPLVIVVLGAGFNLVNGSLLGWHLAAGADYPPAWFSDPRFVGGALLFITGASLNAWADARLIALRAGGTAGYAVPRGGPFELVSCPNHLGEIVEWAGFAVLTWSLPGFAFAFWTAANLIPRALAHHRWYRRTFPQYPAGRRAVLPFVL